MDENKEALKIELLAQDDLDCEKIELEIITPTDETDVRLQEIEDELMELDSKIDKLTNHADKLDYSIAAASGILTGLIDALLVEETSFDIRKTQKNLEEKYHTTNDPAYKHRKKDDNKWVSSSQYHRLEDLAHHPTLSGLAAAILVRFFRVGIFSDRNGKTRTFFIDKNENSERYKNEIKDLCIAWSAATLTGVMVWMAQIAKKKIEVEEKLPSSIKRLIDLVAVSPILVELFITADTWIGHMMSDVSTSAGIPGVFLAMLKEISMHVPFNKLGLPKFVAKLYNNKKMNINSYAGVAFSAIKNQSLSVVMNEFLVRLLYFIRYLLVECKNNGLEKIDWKKTIPFGNRTVERMITISNAVFTGTDVAGAVIAGIAKSKGIATKFAKETIVRINFVGIGKLAISLGNEAVMSFKRGRGLKDRIELNNEALWLMNAKIYQGESLLWSASKNAQESIESLYSAFEQVGMQILDDNEKILEGVEKINDINLDDIEKNNDGLMDAIADML